MYQHPHSIICSVQRLYNVFKLFVGCIQDIDRKKKKKKKRTFLYIFKNVWNLTQVKVCDQFHFKKITEVAKVQVETRLLKSLKWGEADQ